MTLNGNVKLARFLEDEALHISFRGVTVLNYYLFNINDSVYWYY